MGRNSIHKNRDKNKQKLPHVPDQYKKETDGVSAEYSAELTDQDDREARSRMEAADKRAKERQSK